MDHTRVLGAVLAGGRSTRFGTDKALADVGGRTMLARAVDALAGLCPHVIVVGRETAPAPTIPDWPGPDMGPLAGLAGAVRHAENAGFDAVLTCGVDSLGLSAELAALLAPAPAYCTDQPVIGLWPVSAAAAASAILEGTGRHSMLAFARAIGARAVNPPEETANINTPGDLAAAEIRLGL